MTSSSPVGVNMALALHEKSLQMPHKRAVIFPYTRDEAGRVAYTQFTFKQLEQETDRYARGLTRAGIRRGTRTVLMLKPSLEFFALTFALFKIGAVVVLIDPGVGLKNLGICLREASPEAFIGVPKAHAARVLLRWAPDSIKINITHGLRLFWTGWILSDLRDESAEPFPMTLFPPDEMGAIMFTSGSTGVSKGVIYTHGILTNQVQYLQQIYGFDQNDIDLATFPLFALFDVCLGMTAIIPDMDATRPADADPVKLIEAIENQGATCMFGSPALVNTLSRYGVNHGIKLTTLKKVISCGAPARNDVLQRFHQMLPDDAEIFTPYGATEALPVSNIGSREILGETHLETARGGGTCVGKPDSHVQVEIIRISDEAIPAWKDDLRVKPGEIGEIAVRGPIVTRSYFKREESTALAKIPIPGTNDVYHRMGDVGRLDERGRLWFCGRKSHRVETAEGPLFTIPCEAIFNQHPRVFRSALVGVGDKGSQRPVICIELEKDDSGLDLEQLKKELIDLAQKAPHTKAIATFLIHPKFPVDVRHNAKIGRETLAQWAADKLRGKP